MRLAIGLIVGALICLAVGFVVGGVIGVWIGMELYWKMGHWYANRSQVTQVSCDLLA